MNVKDKLSEVNWFHDDVIRKLYIDSFSPHITFELMHVVDLAHEAELSKKIGAEAYTVIYQQAKLRFLNMHYWSFEWRNCDRINKDELQYLEIKEPSPILENQEKYDIYVPAGTSVYHFYFFLRSCSTMDILCEDFEFEILNKEEFFIAKVEEGVEGYIFEKYTGSKGDEKP